MIGIGDYDGKARNRVKVITREGQVMYMGRKYAREKSTGYYVCTSGERKRLHDVIWEHEHEMEVPEGCVIHHKDSNKSNNNVLNLACVTRSDHNLIHNHKKDEEVRVFDAVTGELVHSNVTIDNKIDVRK